MGLLRKISSRIKRMIGTGNDAADNIAFWAVYGIPGMIIIVVVIGALMGHFILWLSEVL